MFVNNALMHRCYEQTFQVLLSDGTLAFARRNFALLSALSPTCIAVAPQHPALRLGHGVD